MRNLLITASLLSCAIAHGQNQTYPVGAGVNMTKSSASAPLPVGSDRLWIHTSDDHLIFTDSSNTNHDLLSGVPAGSNTQVQYNNSGSFGASANFTWTTGTNTLFASNLTVADGGKIKPAANVSGIQITDAGGTNPWVQFFTGNGFTVFQNSSGSGNAVAQFQEQQTSTSPATGTPTAILYNLSATNGNFTALDFDSVDALSNQTTFARIANVVDNHDTTGIANVHTRFYVADINGTLLNAMTINGGASNGTVSLLRALGVASGGTGSSSVPTDGQLLIGSSSDSVYHANTLTQGSGITITNGHGTITIAATGGGTVTSVTANGGLTASPNPIVGAGTVSLATIANNRVFANVSGGTAVPSANTLSDVLDIAGSTRGSVLERGSGGWTVITPGSSGLPFVSGGGGADPSYTTLGVTGGGTGLTSFSQGDMIYASAANTLSALAKNTSATRYIANTGTSNSPNWDQINLANGVTGTLPIANGGTGVTSQQGVPYGVTFDGGALAPTTGVGGCVQAPYNGTITRATMMSQTSGSAVIDVWKANGSIPTVANTIVASDPPTLSSATYSTDTSLTGWTTTVTANDVLCFNLNSASTLTRVTLTLAIQPR